MRLSWLSVVFCFAASLQSQSVQEKTLYGLEMQESLVGYVSFETVSGDLGKEGDLLIKAHTLALLSLMGQGFDLVAEESYRIDRASGNVTYYENKTSMGTMETGSTVEISSGRARFTPRSGGEPRQIELPPDVIVNHPLVMSFLLNDIGTGDQKEKTYPTLNLNDGEIHEITYTRIGHEDLRLMDRDFSCLLFDWSDGKSGEHGKVWIDPESARFVKINQSTGVTLYLAKPEVSAQIRRAVMDDSLFVKVDMPRVDYRLVTYLKVKAVIKTAGEVVSVESLNVPGQRFSGTVKENRIEGTFEIAQKQYGGEAAAPFPPDFSGLEALRKYLTPENLIESDNETILAKAKELTQGSRDAWDAVCRLSCWVSEEIVYEIPGGSACQTLASRKGECGSQSRLLTAMCRAMGIPARLASGCMYTPYFGGSFGVHAWCEVYMGEAGWIPIDATAHEPDHIDSTHIRLGGQTAFYPESMEVIDFNLDRQGKIARSEDAAKGRFTPVQWQPGHTVTFEYAFKGAPLGTDRFRVEEVEGEGPDAVLHVRTDLVVQGRSGFTEWTMTRSGRPLTYNLDGKVGDTEYSVHCIFSEKEVKNHILQAGKPFDYTVPLPERAFLVDNNNLSLFSFLMAGIPLEMGQAQTFDVYHVSSSQVIPLIIKAERRETILFEDKEVECIVCSLNLDGYPLKIWIDDQARILKESEQNGRLVVMRKEVAKQAEKEAEM
ncbi:MAG: transglutaminase domain-containing protein [Planctomycetota bacterium]